MTPKNIAAHYYKNDLYQHLPFFVGAALYWAAPINGCQMSRPYKWICRGRPVLSAAPTNDPICRGGSISSRPYKSDL